MEDEVRINVLTFNIHGFVAQFWTGFKKERTTGKLLNQYNYDIACIQEAWDPNTSRIIKYTGGYKHATHSTRGTAFCPFYGNGLSTITNWTIVERDNVSWRHHSRKAYEGAFGADKGFSWARLKHPHKDITLVVYNLHGLASDQKHYMHKEVYENFEQLGKHIKEHHASDAVLVAGDFNCRHRWRPLDARVGEGPIDTDFCPGDKRYDQYGILMSTAGLTDTEKIIKGEYPWLSPVDRWFFKSGADTEVTVANAEYLYIDTPWHGLSDHHPYRAEFVIKKTHGKST